MSDAKYFVDLNAGKYFRKRQKRARQMKHVEYEPNMRKWANTIADRVLFKEADQCYDEKISQLQQRYAFKNFNPNVSKWGTLSLINASSYLFHSIFHFHHFMNKVRRKFIIALQNGNSINFSEVLGIVEWKSLHWLHFLAARIYPAHSPEIFRHRANTAPLFDKHRLNFLQY